MLDSKSIIDWYYEHDFDRSWLDFDDHLVSAIRHCSTVSQMDAERYATSNSNRLWNQFRLRIEADKQRGLYPTFSEVAPGVKRLFWIPMFFPPGLAKVDRHKRTRMRSRRRITESIRSLNPVEYEALSAVVCKLSGATRISLTPRVRDRGVDLFALIPSVGKSHVFSGGAGPLRIVGQCKMFTGRVSYGDVRDFAYSLNAIRQRGESVKRIIPPWFMMERGPIVGWFVAHSGLQSGPEGELNNLGIMHSDSRDLAEVITMSRAWQPSEGLLAPVDLMLNQIESLLT